MPTKEDTPSLSAEYVALLRAARTDIESDLVTGARGVADLLRLIAQSLDAASARDADLLACTGIALHFVGSTLRDAALAA